MISEKRKWETCNMFRSCFAIYLFIYPCMLIHVSHLCVHRIPSQHPNNVHLTLPDIATLVTLKVQGSVRQHNLASIQCSRSWPHGENTQSRTKPNLHPFLFKLEQHKSRDNNSPLDIVHDNWLKLQIGRISWIIAIELTLYSITDYGIQYNFGERGERGVRVLPLICYK